MSLAFYALQNTENKVVMVLPLYAIGDLHLSLNAEKPMDIFGESWNGHTEKIKIGFSQLSADDTCVLCGDTSWGISLNESLADFMFLKDLPSRKIILKGNHDYWWSTAAKMKEIFNTHGITNVEILHNNCYYYEGVAICGTRGWMVDDEMSAEQNKKILAREVGRLRASLSSAGSEYEKTCFFHYPPRFNDIVYEDLVAVMNEFNVKRCYYGHIHGQGHRYAVQGEVDGIRYEMVSSDYLNFVPKRVMVM